MIVLYVLGALLAVILLYVLFLAVCSLLVNPNKEYTHNSPFYRFVLDSAIALIMKIIRIKVHVTGLEKIPDGKRILFVGNHRSNFDPIVTWYALRKWKIAYISKQSNFKIPFFGRIIRKCCVMAIDRENPREAIKTINKAAALLQNEEVSVGIYPEGTRSKSGELLPFHNGVFKIAQKADASIVVVSIAGTEKIHKQYPFHASHVYLDVLEVIPPEEIKHTKTDVIGDRVRVLLESQLQNA